MENLEPPEDSRQPILKGTGVTTAERYLKTLADRTFLSLWSYPAVYRDQGGGKEICDLLVVFGNHIIIFSDKDCAFPDTGDVTTDWNRWYRRAIKKAAEQIWGAERWIKEHPDRLFLDPRCEQSFPIELPDLAAAVFHRIVVAHSGTERCQTEMGGGSGSLMLSSHVIGDMHFAGEPHRGLPFRVGQVDPSRGFVHVFDDTSLGIVMNTVDTVGDFIAYLTKKESFMTGDTLVLATGEEDLLAFYLKRLNRDGEHDFVLDGKSDGVIIAEGQWEEFQCSPERRAQVAEDKISYTWDALIEKSSYHILTGTQYHASPPGVANSERIMRIMASESRVRRRMLSQALLDLMGRPIPKDHRAVRVLKPDIPRYPYYVFLLLAKPDYATYEEFRLARGNLLEACCLAAKVQFPDAADIVGIATEPGDGITRSEDFMYVDARGWTEEMQAEALELQQKLGLLKTLKSFRRSVNEYPSFPLSNTENSEPPITMKGRERNLLCRCGSGKKYKRCCGM